VDSKQIYIYETSACDYPTHICAFSNSHCKLCKINQVDIESEGDVTCERHTLLTVHFHVNIHTQIVIMIIYDKFLLFTFDYSTQIRLTINNLRNSAFID